ncbi:prolipoprotein diacylglyceryl transferase [Planctomycetota bacterium]
MYPELFEIPFIHVTVKSYGLMMVIGFLAAVSMIRRLSRGFTPDPQLITNAALYSLVGGVIGARIFFVVHYFDKFRESPIEVFFIWQGGLELMGGVIAAISIIFFFLVYHKLPIRRYLDVLAVGLMLTLVFGRIGCFLNGCCYGKPTDLSWGVRFPYYSFAYVSQVNPDPQRNRSKPYMQLPNEYFSGFDENGFGYLKPKDDLTEDQRIEVTRGQYRCLPVHPTQWYASGLAALWFFFLYMFWRRAERSRTADNSRKLFAKPGCTFALMFIFYGLIRFLIETIRDDNPFEYAWWAMYKGGTVSQNLGIYLIVLGVVLMILFQKMKPGVTPSGENNKIKNSNRNNGRSTKTGRKR